MSLDIVPSLLSSQHNLKIVACLRGPQAHDVSMQLAEAQHISVSKRTNTLDQWLSVSCHSLLQFPWAPLPPARRPVRIVRFRDQNSELKVPLFPAPYFASPRIRR